MTSRIDLERGGNNFGVTQKANERTGKIYCPELTIERVQVLFIRDADCRVVGAHGVMENAHEWQLGSKRYTPNTAGLQGVLRYSRSGIPKVNSIEFSSSRPDTKSGSQ